MTTYVNLVLAIRTRFFVQFIEEMSTELAVWGGWGLVINVFDWAARKIDEWEANTPVCDISNNEDRDVHFLK